MRAALSIAAILAALCTAAATAAPPSMSVFPSTVSAGHKVKIKGNADGCPVGDAVTVLSRAFVHTHDFAGVPAVFALVRTGGKFAVRTTIPSTKKHGRYTVTARCGGGNLGVVAHLRVTA
jgi:hypothetical protein